MPLCGFNKEMIEGIAIFSKGLFDATMERGRENGVNATAAAAAEIGEIELFARAMEEKFGRFGMNENDDAEMIYGVALFAHALFRSALSKSSSDAKSLEQSFNSSVQRVSTFLEKLENEHQRLKKINPPDITMQKAAEWIALNSGG